MSFKMRECKECGYVGSHDYDCPNRDDPLPSFFLWYNNGSGHFDCASAHVTLAAAIAAARSGWRTSQHISTDPAGTVIVWKNY